MSHAKRVTRRPVATRAPSSLAPSVPYTGSLTCYSVAFIDKPDLEFGDKVILPPKVLLEIQCLKIPLPLLFKLTPPTSNGSPESCQYCGVMEFSAPMYAPYWMMQQLGVDEGGKVHLESALSIPKGLFCQLQPDQMDFLDIAASIGPKILLESAMRRYSCLSVDGTLVIEYGEEKYFLKILQVQPGPVVHLFGDVDLEVDFKAPQNMDPRRPHSALPRDGSTTALTTSPPPVPPTSAATTYGRRLADGGYVQSSVPQNSTATDVQPNTATAAADKPLSLKDAQYKAKKQTEGLDPLKFKAMKAFATTGHTMTPSLAPDQGPLSPPAPHTPTQVPASPFAASTSSDALPATPEGPDQAPSCPHCLADLPPANADIHLIRCKQHTAYHRYICPACNEKVLRSQAPDHVHCPNCNFVGSAAAVATHAREVHAPVRCTCGAPFAADAMATHKATTCPHTLIRCDLCALSFQRQKFASHYSVCSNRTQQCEVCRKYVNVVSFNQHSDQCVDIAPVVATAPAPGTKPRPEIKPSSPSSPARAEKAACLESPTSHAPDEPGPAAVATFSCPYCGDASFSNMFALDRHTESRCSIAQSFHTTKNPPILRGKLRRKGDLDKPPAQRTLAKAGERIANTTKPATKSAAPISNNNNQQQQQVHSAVGSAKPQSSIEPVVQGSAMELGTSKATRHKQVESLLGRKPSPLPRRR